MHVSDNDDWKAYKESFEKRMAEFKERLAELDYQTDLSIAQRKAREERDKEIAAMLLKQGVTPDQIHKMLEIPMDLILEVQNELLLEEQV